MPRRPPLLRFPPSRKTHATLNGEQLATAIQSGHVHLTRHARQASRTARPANSTAGATAERAAYNSNSNQVTLTGGARLQRASILTDHIVLDRPTRDAQAHGAVRSATPSRTAAT